MYDVFLSHNHKDRRWVKALSDALTKSGLRVFFDQESIPPGASIVSSIEQAIAQSRHVVLIISHASNSSKWVAMETALTICSDPDASTQTLIPVLIEAVPMSELRPIVKSLNIVDLTDPTSRNRRLERLFRQLGVQTAARLPYLPWPDESPQPGQALMVGTTANAVEWGWDADQLLEELIRIDHEVFDGVPDEHEGSVQQWAPKWLDHPDTGRFVYSRPGHIVGYWSFVPLFDADFELARQGRLFDSQITPDRILFWGMPGTCNVYFMNIAIRKEWRHTCAFAVLLEALFDVITTAARNGRFINELCANAFTASGESLCRSFRMDHVADHVGRGKMYWISMKGLLSHEVVKRRRDLVEIYGAAT